MKKMKLPLRVVLIVSFVLQIFLTVALVEYISLYLQSHRLGKISKSQLLPRFTILPEVYLCKSVS